MFHNVSGVSRLFPVLLVAALTHPVFAAGEKVQVIYTEVTGSTTAVVPGARDIAGVPVFTEFKALEDLNISHDGSEWVVKGRTLLGSDLETILVRGSGLTGTAFCQEGQPLLGGLAGEQYDFFDSTTPVSWDQVGRIGFSCRAKGGTSTIAEKVILFDGVNHTVVHQQGDLLIGCQDLAPNPSGDEIFGNSIGSVQLRNNSVFWLANTPIGNCHSSRYPGVFLGNTMFRQSGFSPIGTEIWDSFGYADTGCTPDGLHWFAEGDTENPNTAIDKILVVDDVIVLQEGSPVAGSSMIFTDVFHTRMLSNGDWFARGDDPNDDDWAVKSNVLIAKTGDPITTGATELWGDAFSCFTGNRIGDWVLTGNTTEPDTSKDNVMVLNGATVLLREGDPVDVNGNGLFDDNAFVNSFAPDDVRMSDDKSLYFLVTLRDSAGTGLGDAFMRLSPCGEVVAYGQGCPGSNALTPALSFQGCSFAGELVIIDIKNGLPGSLAFLFFGLGQIAVPMHANCTALVNPLPGFLVLPLDPNGTVAIGGLMPAALTGFNFTMQTFVKDTGVPHGYSNSNGVDVKIN